MRIGCLAAGLVVCALSVARADVDIQKADTAFDDAQRLKAAGQVDQACAKFKESLSFNPNAVGTMLNVAICYQDAGQIGSALKLFTETRDRAKEQSVTPFVTEAEQHIQQIGADVPYVNIVLVQNTPDTKVVVNDQVIAIKADGTASVPVDPGLVSIIVSRPDHIPFEKKLDLVKQQHENVKVDPLKGGVTINRGRRRLGQILTIGGAAVALFGFGLAVHEHSEWSTAIKGCSYRPTAMPSGWYCADVGSDPNTQYYTSSNNAYQLGNVATGLAIGGVVVAAVGGYLWFFGPHEEKLAVVPRIDPGQAGIAAVGRF